MKKNKRPVIKPKDESHRDKNNPGKNFLPFGQKKEATDSDAMPSCFREMWDVFLSFSRLNY